MTRRLDRGNVNYIEVTEKRYNRVLSDFKYVSLDNEGEKHYYLARNRKTLDDRIDELKQGGGK